MCNRAEDQFASPARQDLQRLFGDIFTWPEPRERINPTDPLLAVRLQGDGYAAVQLRWGLIPPGKSPEDLKRLTTTNARVETLSEKPTFRGAFLEGRRCVVPLSAFFEPDATHSPKRGERKRWHRVYRPDHRPLLAAGLWEVTVTPDGPLESVTVVTRDPVPGLDVHDRMPALLLSQDLDAWLHGTPQEALEAAMTSWPSGLLVQTTA
ncbi:SOS response-associated peptidase [Deinococcus aestuarii]|uniref:SOS response-associated peptidase n=1 Tax=Deinococcus aestuarii TaxID=2774531 RepID=UPI001C0DDBA6|nr:SOS response-associated peptidase [Deinococcus aestuarii]